MRPCIPPVHTGPHGGQSKRLWDRAFHPSTQDRMAGIANTCGTVHSTHPHRTAWRAEQTFVGPCIPPVHSGTHGGHSQHLWDRAFHPSTQDCNWDLGCGRRGLELGAEPPILFSFTQPNKPNRQLLHDRERCNRSADFQTTRHVNSYFTTPQPVLSIKLFGGRRNRSRLRHIHTQKHSMKRKKNDFVLNCAFRIMH